MYLVFRTRGAQVDGDTIRLGGLSDGLISWVSLRLDRIPSDTVVDGSARLQARSLVFLPPNSDFPA